MFHSACHSFDLEDANGVWKEEARMEYSRDRFSITSVGDSLFASGGNGVVDKFLHHDSVEMFTQEIGWRLEPRMTMHQPKSRHCSVSIGSWIYIIGGHVDGYASSLVEAFDTSLLLTDEHVNWITRGSMNQVRQSFGCHVGSFEGSHGIFAAGGNGDGLTLDTVEFYEIAEDSWKVVGSLNHARDSFPMSLVGAQIVVTGGQSPLILTSVEIFNGVSWVEEMDELKTGRARHAAVSIPAGKLSCRID